MKSNKKFVILLEILVITFLVMSVVSVCGLSDSSADISAYPNNVNPGDEITVTYPGAPGFEFDGIAVYKAGEQAIYEYGLGKVLYFLDGKKSGTLTITAPDEPGDYEFRLFENAGSTDIARSNVVRVQAGTTVPTPTPTTLSGVHHLGDQTLSDWEVPKSEGTEYTTTFSLTAVPASADLILDVFDTDHNNPVLVNGNSVGISCINTIESWKQCTIKIPGSALRVGSNTLTIQSESRGGNYDDFMIRNIEVTPSSGVHRLGDQTLSDWEVPKPEGTEYTTTFSLTAVPASADLILDVFNTDYNNPVLVNGNSVGILCINPIKSWKQCTIKIPGSALRVGSNTLTIQSESRGGNYDDFIIRNIVVTPSSDVQPTTPTPTTLSGVHHLGDQTLSDWEVPKPEGTEYTTTFSLTTVPASADLILDVFDTDFNNPVLVNGNSVGISCINTIKSWKQCTIKIPGSALRVGSNTLTIQSVSIDRNYDDFMIRNIEVTPSSGVHHLGDQTLSGWEVPKPEGTEYTTTFSLTAVPASADLILDVFDTDFNNPVLVNGNSVGILCINTIEGWNQCTIEIPGSALRVGSNTLTIQSESRGGNYDDFMIRNIEVTPSSKPYIDVVVDDVVIDFGRLDDKRRNFGVGPAPGVPRNHPVPFPNVNFLPTPGIPNWGVYNAPPVQGEVSASTELKRIPIIDDDPHPNITAHFNPSQYPGGMTCVYAIVADADGDAIEAEFVLPTPLFGRGNMYTAIPIPNATNPITSEIELSDGKTLAESFPDGYPIGAILDNYKVMEAYNAILTEYANRGWLPVQPHDGSQFGGLVAPIESLRTPPREFPYVIGFNQGGIRNGSIYPGDIVTEAPNPLGLVPQGTVFKVIVVEGSWTDGDAKGYLWMVPVTDDFWDQRHSTTAVPALFVNNVRKATCSYVGQTIPVIWEAPDDPDVEQTTHDRRHVFDPSTIISKGGTVNIEARVNDPFSPQERAFGLVAFPEKEVGVAAGKTYGGVDFPLGDISFADAVVEFNPGTGTVSPYTDPQNAIGPPDCPEGKIDCHVALGHGGILTVKFIDNYLIDVEGADLYVFEIGPRVEPFKVEISKYGSNWIDLGTVKGQPTSLDIHDKVAPGDKFSYVRITDAKSHKSGHPYAGADIDAVGAIGAEEKEIEESVES